MPILKSLSRKTNAGIRQLVYYINQQAKQRQSPLEQEVEPILWNLRTQENDTRTIAEEFIENANLIKDQSGNRVRVLHEIISFHPEDKSKITADMLEEMGREYLSLRAQDALGYAKPHFDRDALHLHVMISGNCIASPRSSRIDRSKFEEIKIELEAIQRERFPELTQSIVFSKEKVLERENDLERLKKNRSKDRDFNRELRLSREGERKLSKKELLRGQIETAMHAKSREDFERLLGVCNPPLKLYQRGKSWGVSREEIPKPTKKNPEPEPTEMKYRLKTLGVDFDARLLEWELTKENKLESNIDLEAQAPKMDVSEREIEKSDKVLSEDLRTSREPNLESESVLEKGSKEELSVEEKRLKELKAIRNEQKLKKKRERDRTKRRKGELDR